MRPWKLAWLAGKTTVNEYVTVSYEKSRISIAMLSFWRVFFWCLLLTFRIFIASQFSCLDQHPQPSLHPTPPKRITPPFHFFPKKNQGINLTNRKKILSPTIIIQPWAYGWYLTPTPWSVNGTVRVHIPYYPFTRRERKAGKSWHRLPRRCCFGEMIFVSFRGGHWVRIGSWF